MKSLHNGLRQRACIQAAHASGSIIDTAVLGRDQSADPACLQSRAGGPKEYGGVLWRFTCIL